MASGWAMGFRFASRSYTNGTAVGMFSVEMTSGVISSKYFTNARNELPKRKIQHNQQQRGHRCQGAVQRMDWCAMDASSSPWAAITTRLPAFSSGAMFFSQYGSTRSRVICIEATIRTSNQYKRTSAKTKRGQIEAKTHRHRQKPL